MTNVLQRGVVPTIELHHRLRIARELTGLDGQTFAQSIGLSNTGFYNAESGKTRPREITLRAWAAATGVDLHWLRTGEAPPAAADGASGTAARPEGLEPPTFCSGAASGAETPSADLPSVAAPMILLAGLVTAAIQQVDAR